LDGEEDEAATRLLEKRLFTCEVTRSVPGEDATRRETRTFWQRDVSDKLLAQLLDVVVV
jgi:hypothetical protein